MGLYYSTMHEVALVDALLKTVEKTAKAYRASAVKAISLEVGALAAVDPEALRFAFEALSLRTIAHAATLQIEIIPAKGRCPGCQRILEIKARTDPCPYCQSFGVIPIEGTELRLVAIEIEEQS